MAELVERIDVDAPPERVWALLTLADPCWETR